MIPLRRLPYLCTKGAARLIEKKRRRNFRAANQERGGRIGAGADHGAICFQNVGKLTVTGWVYTPGQKTGNSTRGCTPWGSMDKREIPSRAPARVRAYMYIKAAGNHVRKSGIYHQSCRPNSSNQTQFFPISAGGNQKNYLFLFRAQLLFCLV